MIKKFNRWKFINKFALRTALCLSIPSCLSNSISHNDIKWILYIFPAFCFIYSMAFIIVLIDFYRVSLPKNYDKSNCIVYNTYYNELIFYHSYIGNDFVERDKEFREFNKFKKVKNCNLKKFLKIIKNTKFISVCTEINYDEKICINMNDLALDVKNYLKIKNSEI